MSIERPFFYTAGATNIPSGGSATLAIAIDTDADFVIERRDAVVKLNQALGGGVVGSSLPYESSATAANNTMPGLSHLRIECRNTKVQYQNRPVNLKGWVTRNGETYPVTRQKVLKGDTLYFNVYNDSAVALDVEIILDGKKIDPNYVPTR